MATKITKGTRGGYMTDDEAKRICDKIRQVAYDLHVYLGVGHLEKVYENAYSKSRNGCSNSDSNSSSR